MEPSYRDRGDNPFQEQYEAENGGNNGGKPVQGTEIFVGRIPKEMSEEEIRSYFLPIGPILEMRIALDPETLLSKGFAFITYLNKEDASRAIMRLNGKQVRRRGYLKVTQCHPNTRLFVGNIPKAKSKEDLQNEFGARTNGLKKVIIYNSPDDGKKNRGFCFLEYDSHKAAANARRRLSSPNLKIWGCDMVIDWADAQTEPDDDTMSKVRIVYARNIPALVEENELWEVFRPFGVLERVKKIKDFAFIHFALREDAARAINAVNGKHLRGVPVELQWAKPPTDKETRQGILRAREKRLQLQNSLRPTTGAVNPYPRRPMNWDDHDYYYPTRDRGDTQGASGSWAAASQPQHEYIPQPLPPLRNATYAEEDPDSFHPFDEYPIPQISSRVFLMDSDDEETFPSSNPPTQGNRRLADQDSDWRSTGNDYGQGQGPQWSSQQNYRASTQMQHGTFKTESDTQDWRYRP